jgi:hypothetical protein
VTDKPLKLTGGIGIDVVKHKGKNPKQELDDILAISQYVSAESSLKEKITTYLRHVAKLYGQAGSYPFVEPKDVPEMIQTIIETCAKDIEDDNLGYIDYEKQLKELDKENKSKKKRLSKKQKALTKKRFNEALAKGRKDAEELQKSLNRVFQHPNKIYRGK